MPTLHIRRPLIWCPAARQAQLNSWLTTNLDPAGGPWLVQPYNAVGSGAATHYLCFPALTDGQFRDLLVRLCVLTNSVTPGSIIPPAWDTLTEAQKITWLNANLTTVENVTGIGVRVCRNDGVWLDVAAALAAKGLVYAGNLGR